MDGMAIDVLPTTERGRANALMAFGQVAGFSSFAALSGWLLNAYGLHAAALAGTAAIGAVLLLIAVTRERRGERIMPWTAGIGRAAGPRVGEHVCGNIHRAAARSVSADEPRAAVVRVPGTNSRRYRDQHFSGVCGAESGDLQRSVLRVSGLHGRADCADRRVVRAVDRPLRYQTPVPARGDRVARAHAGVRVHAALVGEHDYVIAIWSIVALSNQMLFVASSRSR